MQILKTDTSEFTLRANTLFPNKIKLELTTYEISSENTLNLKVNEKKYKLQRKFSDFTESVYYP